MAILKGAEPFFFPGGEHGIILIHGFTGSPSEMRLLGEYLHKLGHTVIGPRLCGHGTTVEEMHHTNWAHWYSAVEDAYHILKGICSSITVIGLSMGGLMALKLAHDYPVDKLAILSTPIYIADNRLSMLPIYALFRKFIPKKRKKFSGVDAKYSVHYTATPLKSLRSLLSLIKHVDGLLPEVTAPVLIMQSRNEHTVKPQSAKYIYEHIGSSDKQLCWLEKSGHIVTLDIERDNVFEKISQFIK